MIGRMILKAPCIDALVCGLGETRGRGEEQEHKILLEQPLL